MSEAPVIFPGTFDPLTVGHEDLIRRASRLFPQVIVAVASNAKKAPLLTLEERIDMVRACTSDLNNVRVKGFSGLLVDCVAEHQAKAVVRGIRAISDFEYEFQLANMNRRLLADIETIFLTPDEQHTFVSSSLVKEIAMLGGDVSAFLSPAVKALVLDKVNKNVT